MGEYRVMRASAALVALVGWAALFAQYVLLLRLTWNGIGPALATLRFISYFTVLSNLLVAVATTMAALGAVRGPARFFASARVRGGIALCIGVTGAIYFFVLSATWSPSGVQWLVDAALHYVVPVLYLSWWLLCAPHGDLRWGDPLLWMAFPAVFLAWTFLRGAWLHEYPYPFLDVDALGPGPVLRNSLGITALFVALGFALVAIDRARVRER